ncbi:ribosome recycling factor domain-containing protein [Coniochaeta sp. 2T2.1]|nr:ribosome recycling factor domain-containing protein [Coniochaeta sp. 2T2.1]
MRNLTQSGALLRSSRAVCRAVSSVEETTAASISQRILRPSAIVPRHCTPTCASQRPFSQTAAVSKKKAPKQEPPTNNNNNKSSSSTASSSSAAPKPSLEDPFDLSDLEYAFAKSTEHHLNELTKARSGGRFNPDVLGALRVRPDKKNPETFPLHELAAVVPKRGSRKVSILVHELPNVKPIMTAIQASPDFNQQPQRVEDNEQELVLTVEAEDPEETAKRLKDILNSWRQAVRDAKHKREQVVKKWAKDGKIVKDDAARLEKEMQKLQDKKMAEIKAKEKEVEGKS